ncbi:MAG: 5-(carboxyamino)imidazole ribonucleotide synthase [Leptospiraceae bacterium]|nr:5-(carboxyamino)imidazole ribonucleotide synthase [Leptospiraceae bacterium]
MSSSRSFSSGSDGILKPPATIGILGGGQLGRMMAFEARRMGYGIAVLDPSDNCPASHLADTFVCAPFSDESAVKQLHGHSAVLTFEFENVEPAVLDGLVSRPSFEPLYISRNRMREKRMARGLGIATAPFFAVSSVEDLEKALLDPEIQKRGGGILKTCEGGYDGKGQWRLQVGEDLSRELRAELQAYLDQAEATKSAAVVSPSEKESKTSGQATDRPPGRGPANGNPDASVPLILEGLVRFDREFSVVGTGFLDGSYVAFEPVENEHVDGILHKSKSRASLGEDARETALEYCAKIQKHFGYIGTFAVEFFLENGKPVFNEMAPRPHNSGHLTLDASYSSQFEQHVRAICGLPSGDTSHHSAAAMINLIGEDDATLEGMEEALRIPGLRFHWYGKTDSRKGRKMGHITALARDMEEAEAKADEAYRLLRWVRQ